MSGVHENCDKPTSCPWTGQTCLWVPFTGKTCCWIEDCTNCKTEIEAMEFMNKMEEMDRNEKIQGSKLRVRNKRRLRNI